MTFTEVTVITLLLRQLEFACRYCITTWHIVGDTVKTLTSLSPRDGYSGSELQDDLATLGVDCHVAVAMAAVTVSRILRILSATMFIGKSCKDIV